MTASVIRDYVNHMSTKTKYENVVGRELVCVTLSLYTLLRDYVRYGRYLTFLSAEEMITPNPVSTIKQPRFDDE